MPTQSTTGTTSERDALLIEPKVGGVTYLIEDPGNGVIGAALHTGEPYEAKFLYHVYRQRFSGLAIDVGAHVGNHTLFFALVCGLDVIAFEPQEYMSLRANLQLNKIHPDRALAVAAGLSDKPAQLKEVGKHTFQMVDSGGAYPCYTLDSFEIGRPIALMKIDVEGMEPNVLLGARETIKRNMPLIYAEAQDDLAHQAAATVLEPMGYDHTDTFGATPLEEWTPC
jgi:FkbM family methyltransferase